MPDKSCIDEELKEELLKKFAPKREASELLSASYDRLGYESRSERVSGCGTFLEFRLTGTPHTSDVSDKWRLHNANFCRDRLCPMCNFRRTQKIFGQVSQIMDYLGDSFSYIFLTLTVPNCDGQKLSETLDEMQKGFRKFVKYKRVSNAVCGVLKSLEITRNKKNGTYHPHYHCILAVKESYFTGKDYIKHDDWLSMWQKAMKNPDITQVDVRRCKPKEDIKDGDNRSKSIGAAVAEVAKYSVKSVDYLVPDDPELTDDIVSTLSAALLGRRLFSFSGIFDEVRKSLALDDCENGDLVITDSDDGSEPGQSYLIRRYSWVKGSYILIEETYVANVNISADDDPDSG